MLKEILIHWDGHGDVDIGSLMECRREDDSIQGYQLDVIEW